jgi:hypothetical protein
MKKITLLIGIIFLQGAISLQSQDSIPNYSFEDWNTSTSPANWHTVNELLPPGKIACNQTTNSFEGSYALSMKTIDLDGMLVPAVASLGIVGMGFTEGGIPYSGRPESLNGYFKHPSTGDAVMLAVQFYKQGVQIGGGYWSTSDSVADYTQFIAPISFSSADFPDTLNITILTDQYVLGSTLTIDALEFEFPPVNISEAIQNSIKVYPNPCSDYISIETGENLNSVRVINLSGRVVLEKHEVDNDSPIDLKGIPEGMYILQVETENATIQQKIVKR